MCIDIICNIYFISYILQKDLRERIYILMVVFCINKSK